MNVQPAGAVAATVIKFTGHGYEGTIGAAAGLSAVAGNLVGITLTPQ
jgi:hypothetical protein